jgi:SAM-dependent methyltransferase
MQPEAIHRVAVRYARGSRFQQGYVRAKLSSDPVCAAVLEEGLRESLGEVLDVGCGRGQLAVLLLEAGAATTVLGLDWDQGKIELARACAEGLAARFDRVDFRRAEFPPCDTVLLVDVLHYMSPDEQDAVLLRAARAARRRLFLRELDPDRGWRSAVTRLQEAVTTGLGVNAGARLVFRPIVEYIHILERGGFRVDVEPAWGSTPFSNVLLRAAR